MTLRCKLDGLLLPADFLPLAEEAGLMGPLTELVLEQALSQCAAWRAQPSGLMVSVNVSATNLLDPDFTNLIGTYLKRHLLSSSALILEITETTVIREFERCKRVIAQLRESGLSVSIDDFGAGFTSLAYLGSLAVSEIKLDRAFIASLAVHLSTYLGAPPLGMGQVWPLHLGIFLVFIPVVLAQPRNAKTAEAEGPRGAPEQLAYAPGWMRAVLGCCFVYTIANFLILILKGVSVNGQKAEKKARRADCISDPAF